MKNLDIKLVKGVYDGDEASDILLNLLGDKIDFLKARKFSQELRLGVADMYIQQRIDELRLDRAKLRSYLSSASSKQQYKIHCELKIEMEDEQLNTTDSNEAIYELQEHN